MSSSKSKTRPRPSINVRPRLPYSEEYTSEEIKKIEKKRRTEEKIAKKERKYKKKLEERLTKQLDEKIRKAKGKIAPISLSVPKGTPVIWSPNPGSQIRFLMCPFDEVLLEGNRGGGKTDVLLMDFIQHVNKGYGEAWRGILFRESYPQLADIIAKSKKWIPRMFPGSIFNKSEKTWTFPWGEQLLLRFMETPDDYNNYHGHEYPWIGWEELTNWATPECYNIMRSCNRSSHSKVPIKYRATCNPGGIGNQWVKARFVDIGPQMTVFTDEQGKKRCRITSRLDENKVLLKADPNYKNTLLSLTQDDPIKRKAWVKGSWNIIMGAALTDIWENKTHVIKPFKFPKTWRVYRSFDYGSQKPWAVTYGAVSNGENPDDMYYPKDTVFIIAELYGWNGIANQGDGATSIEIAEKVAEMDALIEKKYKCRVHIGPADTSIWEVRDGKSIANSMNALGCRWTRAYKGAGSRTAGLAEVRQRLGAAKRGEVESPGLYFFDTTYHHIRTLTILPRDKNNNEDVDSSAEDHCWDSLRYLLSRKMAGLKRGKVKV